MYTDESIIYADIQDGVVVGYYTKEIHGEDIPETAIPITAELHQKLLESPRVGVSNTMVASIALNENRKDYVIGIEQIDNFIPLGYEPIPEEELYTEDEKRIQILEAENMELKNRLKAIEQKLGL